MANGFGKPQPRVMDAEAIPRDRVVQDGKLGIGGLECNGLLLNSGAMLHILSEGGLSVDVVPFAAGTILMVIPPGVVNDNIRRMMKGKDGRALSG